MFKVQVTATCKEQFTQDDHVIFDLYNRDFDTKQDALDYIADFEGTRVPMYRDKIDGTTVKCGYIFKTRETSYDRFDRKNTIMITHRWVELFEVDVTPILAANW